MKSSKLFGESPAQPRKPKPKVLDNPEPVSAVPTASDRAEEFCDFNMWLQSKKTRKRDFKMKSGEFSAKVAFVLDSFGIKPTMNNFRRYDAFFDWDSLAYQLLQDKGIDIGKGKLKIVTAWGGDHVCGCNRWIQELVWEQKEREARERKQLEGK